MAQLGFLQQLMMDATNSQVADFKEAVESKISDGTITTRVYLTIFLDTFLGNGFADKAEQKSEDKFKPYCINFVDKVSLANPEIKFFHDLINISDLTSVEQLTSLYQAHPKLQQCQLGNGIRRCIEAFPNLKFSN